MSRSFPDSRCRLASGLLAVALAGCPVADDADATDGDETGVDSGSDSGTTVEVPGDSGDDSDTWPWMTDTADDSADSGDSGTPPSLARTQCRDPSDPNRNPFRDTSDGRLSVEELCPGDLVVTEVQRGSTDGAPVFGAYLEVVNPTPWEVVLSGVQIDIWQGPNQYAVRGVPIAEVPGGVAVLDPGERVVIGLHPTEPHTHLIHLSFRTGEIVQPYAGSVVYLMNGVGWAVDAADYSGHIAGPGVALQLRPEVDVTDYDAVHAPGAWCPGGIRLPLAGAGGLGNDRGTPGFENVCDPPLPVDTGDSGDTDTDTDSGDSGHLLADSGDSGDTDVDTGHSGAP